jgi:hypothetical protein
MVIEFKIQLDDAATGRAYTARAVTNTTNNAATGRAVTAQAVPNPNSPAQKLLPAVFPAPVAAAPAAAVPAAAPAAAAPAAAALGGAAPAGAQESDAPLSDLGTGSPSAVVPSIPGSGMMFVLGPIVVCGSGPGHSGLGGDAPLSDLGTGRPDAQAATPRRK